MKNLTLIILLSFSMNAIAQNTEINDPLPNHKPNEIQSKTLNKWAYSNWKYPFDAAETIGGTFTEHMNFLFQDSSVVWVDGVNKDSVYHHRWHAAGAVFDPTDVNFEVYDDGIRLTRFNFYNADSLYIPYSYVRYIDSIEVSGIQHKVIDTLVVQFYTYDQLELDDLNANEIYGKSAEFSMANNGHSTPIYEVKILLDENFETKRPDANGWELKDMVIGLPDIQMEDDPALMGRRVCGYNLYFKTMIPYEFGDTLEIPADTNYVGLNYFGHKMYVNEGTPVIQEEYYNNGFFTNGKIAYGDTLDGWVNNIPGNAYSEDRYIYYAIHVAWFMNVDELELNNKFKIYPNPSNSDHLFIETEGIEINAIYLNNALGAEIEVEFNTLESDLSKLSLPQNMESGIYFLKIDTKYGSMVKKVVIN